MIADAAPPPAVAPAPIRFAPPLDRVLRFETVEERAGRAGPMRFRMEHEARFRRVGAGYWLELRQVVHGAEAEARIARVFDAAMAPFDGVTVTLTVAADGSVGPPLDAAATWAKVLEAEARMRAMAERDPALPPAARAAVAAVLDRDAAATSAERDARLGDQAAELLGFAAPALAPGRAVATSIGRGAARLEGEVRYERADAAFARFAVDLASPPGTLATTTRHDEITVDRRTGLIERLVSRREASAPGVPPTIATYIVRRLDDAPP